MTPVMFPTPATGAVVVQFADHVAISVASVTLSFFSPARTKIGAPDRTVV
jgi:hypothetical protein